MLARLGSMLETLVSRPSNTPTKPKNSFPTGAASNLEQPCSITTVKFRVPLRRQHVGRCPRPQGIHKGAKARKMGACTSRLLGRVGVRERCEPWQPHHVAQNVS